uniref:Uncharacterized protein n=1 Tax=Compsopogon caeruleus TaxID=31354 RepID=A0A7S1TD06_9RHOD|mmetsp:Transcript_14502/g.29650  ORF Transcript_14502/g.29650 Transcript_14502/m.29650 type:complete len:122 (+) Transcript_14502:824-1189(+)
MYYLSTFPCLNGNDNDCSASLYHVFVSYAESGCTWSLDVARRLDIQTRAISDEQFECAAGNCLCSEIGTPRGCRFTNFLPGHTPSSTLNIAVQEIWENGYPLVFQPNEFSQRSVIFSRSRM